MKVLIPNFVTPDSFTENVSHTLRLLGHEVLTLQQLADNSLMMRFHWRKDGYLRRLVRDYVSREDEIVIEMARKHRPDMVLSLTKAVAPPALRELRKAGVKHLVAWWGDAPANMPQMGLLTDEWDCIFLKDPDAVRKFRRVGLNTHLLFEAMNPTWHRPLASVSNDDVVVVGNFYAFRQFLVRRIIDAGYSVGLYSGAHARWVDPEIVKRHSGRTVFREDKSRVFGEGLACLNSMHIVEGNSLNCRAFEVAGAAGLQLIEYRPIIETAFEPGKEILVFDSMPELFGYIDRAKQDRAWADSIRAAGHKRALAEHTYAHRLKELFRVSGAAPSK